MKVYLAYYFTLLSIVGSVLLLPVAAFYLAGEYDSYTQVIQQQRETDSKCLYGSAIHNTDFDYKAYLLREVKPKVLVLGSSRVLQMRARFFSQPAITAGRAMTSITEGRAFLQEVLANPPEIVIIGADYAWFNGRDPQPAMDIEAPIIKAGPDYPGVFSDGVRFYKWLSQGRFALGDLASVFNPGICDIGLAARSKKKGYGPDGSYYYTDIVTGKTPSADSGFKNSIADVDRGLASFKYAAAPDDKSVHGFLAMLETLKKNDIYALVFFPPYPSPVNEHRNKLAGKYAYIAGLKTTLQQNHIGYYDFTDASVLGADDCEFIDGFHGGEVLYARILNAMADADDRLQPYVDRVYLHKVISEHKGKAFVPDSAITAAAEIDFLKLGCRKH